MVARLADGAGRRGGPGSWGAWHRAPQVTANHLCPPEELRLAFRDAAASFVPGISVLASRDGQIFWLNV